MEKNIVRGEKREYVETLTILESREHCGLAYVNADGTVSEIRTAGELRESNEEYLR